jgi:hypothetical protein
MAIALITERQLAVQYDGFNSEEIRSVIIDFGIVSEIDGVLVFVNNGTEYTVNTGDWVRSVQGMPYGIIPASQFAFVFTVLNPDVTVS